MPSASRHSEEFGPKTKWEIVRADTRDPRPHLAESPLCDQLQNHHIAHVGRIWARAPFEVVRADATGTFAFAGIEGEGKILVDGSWRTVRAGEMCLLPAFTKTGIRATKEGTKVWQFAYVRYEEERERAPILSADSPVIHKGDVLPLNHAIAGLVAEVGDGACLDPTAVFHWIELIHRFVIRVAQPYQGDDRLWLVWDHVKRNLTKDWTLSDLAQIGNVSAEHLRRLSKEQLGRSPIQQVTYLRMRRAVQLLTSTHETIEAIAMEVGYENPFTFSNAFKRCTGKRPSEFRE